MAHLDALASALERGRFDLREALWTATHLAFNGMPSARSVIRSLQAKTDHADASKFFDKLLNVCDYADRLESFHAIRRDPILFRKLYDLHGSLFIKGSTAGQKLVVVFTTMFNNFGISNAILLAILKKFGVSVLLLRDCTRSNYLGGASGFGGDLDELSSKIAAVARQQSIEQIYLMGYSSGGYASFHASMHIACAGHLAFSSPVDFSPDTKLPTDWFIKKELRTKFDPRYLLDLAQVLPNVPARRRLVVGSSSTRDIAHARHVASVAGLEVIEIADSTHDTPQALLARGEFEDHIEWLLGDA